jgi:hypothetical protein
MEERLKDALASAGEMLAEALRAGLVARGLPGELGVAVQGGRVVVGSASAAVRDAEVGAAGRAPAGVLEEIGRRAAPHIVARLASQLGGFGT